MTILPFDFEVADRNRTLFLLDAKISAARTELGRLDALDGEAERRRVSRHESQLMRANERLVLSALGARADAEAMREDLGTLARVSQRDPLTDIPNRSLSHDRLETAIASARRNGRKLGVLFVDLDAFKSINDRWGHAAGDRALKAAATRLTEIVRDSDTVGRLGGDEFLVVLPDVDSAREAELVASKMLSALSRLVAEEDAMSASIGIAVYPQDALTGADLIDCADKAMYRAKSRGGSHIEFYDSSGSDVLTGSRPSNRLLPSAYLTEDPPNLVRLADLQQANEHLVLAALTAQGLQTKAENILLRQAMFLAMVAHELRNPLNPIRMATELLSHAHANEGLTLQVQGILTRQVRHLARLVDDLLDGARASAGKFQLEWERVSLREVLDSVIDATRLVMQERQQTMVTHLTSERMTINGDPLRLAQIFSNLLENASKYTRRGGEVSVDLSCMAGVATLSITDNGIGISAEALPRIFDLFAQEPHARAHDRQGLGLGLAIVRELVEAHGGTIVAASGGRDLGSQFVLALPMLADATPAPVASDA